MGNRLGIVRRFARYAHAVDPRHEVPPPSLLSHRYRRPQPYLYSNGEIDDLLRAAQGLSGTTGLRPCTYATLLTTNEEENPMRPTTILRRLLGVTQLHVQDAHIAAEGPLALRVRPSWRRSRCGACGRRAPRYDRRPWREWLHVPWGRTPVWLQYAPWRVSCRQCGVRVGRVPWAVGHSVFTAPLEELAAYLAQVTDRTTVSRLLGISWPAVGSVVERVVARRLNPGRLAGLRRIVLPNAVAFGVHEPERQLRIGVALLGGPGGTSPRRRPHLPACPDHRR